MSTQIQDVRSRIRHDGRGIASETTVRVMKELWDRFGLPGYGVAVVAFLVVSYYLFTVVFGTIGAAFTRGDVTGLASLLAVVYTGWIGFVTYEEYTDRDLSRRIRERPSIATVDQAFGLLQSDDDEARLNASVCLNAVVATSPKNVVNTTDASTEEIIEYLLPFVRSESSEIGENIGDVIAFVARDYPDGVRPFRDDILDMARDRTLGGTARGNLALAVGFLLLSERTDDDDLRATAVELSEDEYPDVRIGACYMLAGIPNRETTQRLREMAASDPEDEVREHAEELV